MRLDGKVAVVTGGSGGIGSAALRRFVAEGARVVCVDLADEAGEKLVADLSSDGSRAVYQHADVGEPAEVARAIETAVDRFGRIDVLFNNAAASTGGYVADLDVEGWGRSLRTMLSAALYGMQAAIPHMIAQGGGSIISTSSIYGLVSSPGIAPYATAKAGLINLTRTAALEYGRKNIRVNAICPGVVDTAMFEQALRVGSKSRDEVAGMHALGRIIRPEEVASLALFLASDESSAITGQAIVIDGGLLSGCDLTGTPPVA